MALSLPTDARRFFMSTDVSIVAIWELRTMNMIVMDKWYSILVTSAPNLSRQPTENGAPLLKTFDTVALIRLFAFYLEPGRFTFRNDNQVTTSQF